MSLISTIPAYQTDISQLSLYAEINIERALTLANEKGINEFTIFMSGADKSIPTNRPVDLKEEILSKINKKSSVSEIRKTQRNVIIIKTSSIQTAREIAAIANLRNTVTKNILPKDSIQSEFLIFNVNPETSLAEIYKDLWQEGIYATELHRFSKSIEGNKIPSNIIKVSQIGFKIPDRIIVCLESFRAALYIPKPRQCQRCWRFGHGKNSCRSKAFCRLCSEDHLEKDCPNPNSLKCKSCSGHHSADDKSCVKLGEEKEILKIKAERNISYDDSKKLIQQQNQNSFSKITKSSSTQNKENTNLEKRLALLEQKLEKVTTEFDSKLEAITEKFTKSLETIVEKINLSSSIQVERIENLIKPILNVVQKSSTGRKPKQTAEKRTNEEEDEVQPFTNPISKNGKVGTPMSLG